MSSTPNSPSGASPDSSSDSAKGFKGPGGVQITPHLIVLSLLIIAVLIFVFQNSDTVYPKFLILSPEMPLWLFIVLMIALGVLIDRLVLWIGRRGANKDQK